MDYKTNLYGDICIEYDKTKEFPTSFDTSKEACVVMTHGFENVFLPHLICPNKRVWIYLWEYVCCQILPRN